MESKKYMEKLEETLKEIQTEAVENDELHQKRHHYFEGIRSSQISALVGWMIKKGIIKK